MGPPRGKCAEKGDGDTGDSCHGKKEAEQGHQDTSELEFVAFGGRDSVKDLREARDRSFPETHMCVSSQWFWRRLHNSE